MEFLALPKVQKEESKSLLVPGRSAVCDFCMVSNAHLSNSQAYMKSITTVTKDV